MSKSESNPTHLTAQAVIPVLDLMIGQVVLARGGHRDQYTPIHTKLTTSSDPLTVARAMFGQTGCECLYLADLDCHEGASPNWVVYEDLLRAGFRIWVDADWLTGERLEILAKEFSRQSIRPIVSTESMTDMAQMEQLGNLVANGLSPIFSIDAKGEKVLSKTDSLHEWTPIRLAEQAVANGVETIIYLDLECVGTDGGTAKTTSVIRNIKNTLPSVSLISGGGVRSVDDAAELVNGGCQHVLVASAIHNCQLRPDDITQLNELRQKVLA